MELYLLKDTNEAARGVYLAQKKSDINWEVHCNWEMIKF